MHIQSLQISQETLEASDRSLAEDLWLDDMAKLLTSVAWAHRSTDHIFGQPSKLIKT